MIARLVDSLGHRSPLVGNNRLAHAPVGLRRAAFNQSESFEFCYLAADRRVVAAGPVRQFSHADRTETPDADQ